MSESDLVEAGTCASRPDPMNLVLGHCWHPDHDRTYISTTDINLIHVKCCFCACYAIGIPKYIKDPEHGRYCPQKVVSYEYKITDVAW